MENLEEKTNYGIGQQLWDLVKAEVAGIKAVYTIPTCARQYRETDHKRLEENTKRMSEIEKMTKGYGFLAGISKGLVIPVLLSQDVNPRILLFPVLTNLFSGVYELSKYCKRKINKS